MDAWLNRTGEAIIAWGTKSPWYRPTVAEVISEEVLPHVILALHLLIGVQLWLSCRSQDR
jgi:hypothetical protein